MLARASPTPAARCARLRRRNATTRRAAPTAGCGCAAGPVRQDDRLCTRNIVRRTEVLTQVDRLDSKNEAAHAGIVTRVDALAHDVAFLAGRQKERGQRANRPDEGQ